MSDIQPLVRGICRAGVRTKELAKTLSPGEIALIDHVDLDFVGASGLIRARCAAVLNVASSISGRYPNEGPSALVEAGVLLVDLVDADSVFEQLDGRAVEVMSDGRVRLVNSNLDPIAGTLMTDEVVAAELSKARRSMGSEYEQFARNTLDYMSRELHLLTDEISVPALKTEVKDRQVLMVVRGPTYMEDLRALGSYVREVKPVLVGVDGGADALIESGLKPHLIVGDFDSVSDTALRCGAELVVHAYEGGSAPGAERLDELGLKYATMELTGTSEDVAMLIAYELGAALIVAVGTHTSMVDFLDKGRAGMASSFLTRIRVGPILMEAKGVSKLYRSSLRTRDIVLLVGSAVATMTVVASVSQPIRLFIRSFWTLLTG